METIDDRSIKLIGEEKINYIKSKNILLVGLGGVGSIVASILVRSGISHITIIDKDIVSLSNLNRQIMYDLDDLGKRKVDVTKEKLLKIRCNLDIKTLHLDIKELGNHIDFKKYDFVIDCIDDIKGKILLIKNALENDIKIVSSLGMGNKLNVDLVKIDKINKSSVDPLARKLRYELKRNNLDLNRIYVCYSTESPLVKDKTITSMAFVPNICGIKIANFIIKYFLKEVEENGIN